MLTVLTLESKLYAQFLCELYELFQELLFELYEQLPCELYELYQELLFELYEPLLCELYEQLTRCQTAC